MMVPLYWSHVSGPIAIALIFPQLTLEGLDIPPHRRQTPTPHPHPYHPQPTITARPDPTPIMPQAPNTPQTPTLTTPSPISESLKRCSSILLFVVKYEHKKA